MTAGAVGVLNKPFPPEALLAEVNRALSAKVSPPQETGDAAAVDKPAAEQEPNENILLAPDEIETGEAEEELLAAFPLEEMEQEKLLREAESLLEDIDNLPDEKNVESLESDVTETAAESPSVPQTAPARNALFGESFDEEEKDETQMSKSPDTSLAFDPGVELEAAIPSAEPSSTEGSPGEASLEYLDIDVLEAELEGVAPAKIAAAEPETPPTKGLDLESDLEATVAGKVPDEQDVYFDTATKLQGLPPEDPEDASQEKLDIDAIERELEDAAKGWGLDLDIDGDPEGVPTSAAEDLGMELEPERIPESAAELEIDLDIEEEAETPLALEDAAPPEVIEVEAEPIEELGLDLESEISLPQEDTAAPAPPVDAKTPDETAREAPTKDIGIGEDALRSLTEKKLERAVEALVPSLVHRIETLVAEMIPSIAEKIIVREIERLKRGE
jgi:hypothetical protein